MTKTQRKTAARKKATKPVHKKATSKKAAARKKTAVGKKTATKKPAIRKTASKKRPASKKAASRKTTSRKTTTKKTATHKVSPRKKATRRNIHAHTIVAGIAPYQPRRGEPYMNEPQREHFARLLDAWKQELMEEVDRTVHHMQDEASNFPDPNDRASQESEFSLELRTRDRERKLLRKIEQTIVHLEMNEYGWCEACGAEIGIRRLEARPTATLCIDCKTLDELRERQTGT